MKLANWHSRLPIDHDLVPQAQRSFTVGYRGVLSIDAVAEGVLVTFVPRIDSENPKDMPTNEAMRLLVKGDGAGVPEQEKKR